MLRLPRPAATAVIILLTAADAVYTQVSRPSIPPRDTTAAPQTGTARIRGRVTFELKGGQSLSDVHIVLTDKLTEVSGSVTDDRGRPLTNYVVVVLPSEPKESAAAMRFTRTTRPDQQGAYRIRGLPPGEYLAAAVESLEQGREWDPEFQGRVRDAARRITLTEGRSLALDLKLTAGF